MYTRTDPYAAKTYGVRRYVVSGLKFLRGAIRGFAPEFGRAAPMCDDGALFLL